MTNLSEDFEPIGETFSCSSTTLVLGAIAHSRLDLVKKAKSRNQVRFSLKCDRIQ
ncbi:hypothetical protein [Synechocystis sp. PCC 7509]|uniref:hypothetical protein n=1 Tax=Synechocystis sp. PCC 7509 TaxID=927677 RepID=UPI00130E10B7|nr:hypothetical protein [Synechocystis sp. PCC 7509]